MFRPRRRGMQRREGLGLLLLLHQLYRVGFDRIPPTTLGTVVLNVVIYLRVLNPYLKAFIRTPSIKNICVSTAHVWYKGDWPRLFLAAWFHLDEWHLYFNMASFLWKGLTLERRFGTPYFAYLILIFSGLTNLVLVALNIGLSELMDDGSPIVACAAGFSGVIFALKVLTTYYTPAHSQRIMGLFSVPSRWACWVELVLIQIMVPRASFTGHLAGILVGLAYVKGPLKILMDAVWHMLSTGFSGGVPGVRYQPRADATGYRPQGQTTGRTTGASNPTRQGYRPPPSGPSSSGEGSFESRASGGASPTLPSYRADDFTGGMSEDEQIQAALRNSMARDASYDQNGIRVTGSGGGYQDDGIRVAPTAPPVEDDAEERPRLYPDLSNHHGDPPPYPQGSGHGTGMSPDELRRRRLAHLNR